MYVPCSFMDLQVIIIRRRKMVGMGSRRQHAGDHSWLCRCRYHEHRKEIKTTRQFSCACVRVILMWSMHGRKRSLVQLMLPLSARVHKTIRILTEDHETKRSKVHEESYKEDTSWRNKRSWWHAHFQNQAVLPTYSNFWSEALLAQARAQSFWGADRHDHRICMKTEGWERMFRQNNNSNN